MTGVRREQIRANFVSILKKMVSKNKVTDGASRQPLLGDRRNAEELAWLEEISAIQDLRTDILETLGLEHDDARQIEELYQAAVDLHLLRHDVRIGAQRLEVAIIGDFNAGKSTFINSVLGAPLCPIDVCPTTSAITRFTFGRAPAITCDARGPITDVEYAHAVRHPAGDSAGPTPVYRFEYAYPAPLLRDLVLVDTPGFANPDNPNDTELTIETTRQADAVFFILDVNKGAIAQDTLELLSKIRSTARDGDRTPWYLVLNKADLRPTSKAVRVRDKLLEQHGDLFRDALLYSALRAPRGSTEPLFTRVQEEVAAAIRDRLPVLLSIEGTPAAGAYSLRLGEETWRIAQDGDAVLDAAKVFENLRELAQHKEAHLSARLRSDLSSYRAHRTRTLHTVRRALSTESTSKRGAMDPITFQHEVRKALERASRGFAENARRSLSCIQVRKKPIERWYWNTERGVVEMDAVAARNYLSSKHGWDEVFEALVSLERLEEEHFGTKAVYDFRTGRKFTRAKKRLSERGSKRLLSFCSGCLREFDSVDEALHVVVETRERSQQYVADIQSYGLELLLEGVSPYLAALAASSGRDAGKTEAQQQRRASIVAKVDRLLEGGVQGS